MITLGLIIDPLDTLQVKSDTSLRVIAEANRRQHKVFVTTLNDLYLKINQTWASWQEIHYRSIEDDLLKTVGTPVVAPLSQCDVVFMRKDPPVDTAYIASTHILDYANTTVLNSPAALRNANEKLSTLTFPDLVPLTFVSRNIQDIAAFIAQEKGEWVVKPLNRRGGEGVVRVAHGQHNIRETLVESTQEENEFVMIQRFLPGVYQGDKRVFLVGRQAIGWVNRIPSKDDFRANLRMGGRPEKCDLTERDREIVAAVGERLERIDAPIAGLDIIAGHLSEINITSPTGIAEINKITGKLHESFIVDYLEKRASH